MTFDDPAFKRLKDQYYKLLKEAGFSDIEDTKGRLLDHQTAHDFSQRIGFRTEFFENIRDYYIWAYQVLHYKKFKSMTDKIIWEMHADGKSSRDISAFIGLDQRWISIKIKKIRKQLYSQEEDGKSRE